MSDMTAGLVEEYFATGTLAGLPDRHFIDGDWHASVSGDRMGSLDPGLGRAFHDFAAGGRAEAGLAVDAIAANNDEMAIGAIMALQQAGSPPGKILVGGIDATPDALGHEGLDLDPRIILCALNPNILPIAHAASLGIGRVDLHEH